MDNLKQASRWYTGSGIYRHVWLNVTEPLHVARSGTYVTTPEITSASAKVTVETTLRNDSDVARNATLITRLMDPQDHAAGTEQSIVRIPARSETVVKQFLHNFKASALVTGDAASLPGSQRSS